MAQAILREAVLGARDHHVYRMNQLHSPFVWYTFQQKNMHIYPFDLLQQRNTSWVFLEQININFCNGKDIPNNKRTTST